MTPRTNHLLDGTLTGLWRQKGIDLNRGSATFKFSSLLQCTPSLAPTASNIP